MKITANNNPASNQHSSKPFFNNKAEGAFFSPANGAAGTFFTPVIIQTKSAHQHLNRLGEEPDLVTEKAVPQRDTVAPFATEHNNRSHDTIIQRKEDETTVSRKPGTDVKSRTEILANFITTSGPMLQRQLLQLQRHDGGNSQESVALLQELSAGENTAAMRVVIRAIDQAVISSGDTVHIACRGGGEQFDLTITSEDAVTMRTQLSTRIHTLSEAAHSSRLEQREAPLMSIDPLMEGFNREFQPILGALRNAGRIMSGDEDAMPPGDEFTTAELHEMFSSETGRHRMLGYINTHVVPDRLFNGDDAGNSNAQQRILMSAHILTHGTIQRGSFTQRIHARFCGHWVELVNNYAGVAATGGRGIENEFDHEGNPVMGSDQLTCVYEGHRTEVAEGDRGEGQTHRRFRRTPLPIADFETIQPADWLYVFTGTDTAGGDHSVIFSNWLSEYREAGGIHYRKAAVFSQTNPARGGSQG